MRVFYFNLLCFVFLAQEALKKVRLTPPQNVEGEVAAAVPETFEGQIQQFEGQIQPFEGQIQPFEGHIQTLEGHIQDSNQPSFRHDISSAEMARLTPIRTSDLNQPTDLIQPLQAGSPAAPVTAPEETPILQPPFPVRCVNSK